VPSMQTLPQPSQVPIGPSIPTRIRVVPPRDQGQGSSGSVAMYHHGSWLPDMAVDQRLHRNQPHPSMGTRTVPSYRPVGPPSRPGSTVTLRDVSSMSREALNRVAASSLGSGFGRGTGMKCNYLWMSISRMRMIGCEEETAQSQPPRLTAGVTQVMLIMALQLCMGPTILCPGQGQAHHSCGASTQ
jgi:hypothetical protein